MQIIQFSKNPLYYANTEISTILLLWLLFKFKQNSFILFFNVYNCQITFVLIMFTETEFDLVNNHLMIGRKNNKQCLD